MIIDAFTHFCPRNHVLDLARYPNQRTREIANRMQSIWKISPNFVDEDVRLSDLEKYSIDIEVTMIQHLEEPNSFGLPEEDLVKMCRSVNDQCAEFQSNSKDRIWVMGIVPFVPDQKKEIAIEEMRRASHELGLKGFMVLSNIHGEPIDRFDYFWREAERLEAVIYIHPFDAQTRGSRPYEFDFDLQHIFGWPYETTLALSRLIFSGTVKRYPSLKIVSHHMGGMIPFFSARISETYSPRQQARQIFSQDAKPIVNFGAMASEALERAGLDRPILEYFKRFYYDTATGGSSPTITLGKEIFGSDHLVFGTDYPWGPDSGRKRLADYPLAVRGAIYDAKEQQNVFENNVRKLLKI